MGIDPVGGIPSNPSTQSRKQKKKCRGMSVTIRRCRSNCAVIDGPEVRNRCFSVPLVYLPTCWRGINLGKNSFTENFLEAWHLLLCSVSV